MSNLSTTSDDILRCARKLIIEGGYNGFSYADIADVVGIRKASIHHHFPAKSDLVRALVARYREEMEAGVAALEREVTDPAAQLRAYAGYWRACIVDDTEPFCVCALLASQIPVLPEDVVVEVRAHFRGLSRWLASVLRRGGEQGVIALSAPAEAEAEVFMATVHGAMLSARAYGDPAVFGAIVDPLLLRLEARG
ncbi:TetR/AcrR family transcriptional regulator [Rhizobium cremeum]|uniref:TetR/AcrR family transcriptional regulator n=1 Tax=Rhizobium cremeum TaxID=2813827 RepID=UPI000DDE784C|nr:TetR/AcrR family transcriptional regulator [Rhizobium cremeum]MCJ7996173.1 TetR/AcrR family transcriptional regulator [Rhizobium cremeum]MCJ8001432.1 TetR/AcrR family transcriptional regulator [Rhizobium cremeum]